MIMYNLNFVTDLLINMETETDVRLFVGYCMMGIAEKVMLSIAKNENIVNAQDDVGDTGLMKAMMTSRNNIVRMILASPIVDLSIANFLGHTALFYGFYNPEGINLILMHSKCTKYLVLKQDVNGETVLDYLNRCENHPSLQDVQNCLQRYLEVSTEEFQFLDKLGEIKF